MGRRFWRLWTARTISRFGDGFFFIAISWLIFARTHSVVPLGAAWAAYLLVTGLGQSLLGPLPDLWDRRRLMVALDVARGVLLLASLLVLRLGPTSNVSVIDTLFLLAGLLSLPYASAASATLPSLLPEDRYRQGNVWLQGGSQAVYFIGPAAGGFFIARYGAPSALALDALTFFASAALLSSLRVSPRAHGAERRTSYAASLRDGLRTIARTRVIALLTLLEVTYSAADAAFLVLSVPLVRAVLHGSAAGVGLLEAAASLGVLVASPVLQPLARLRPRSFLAGAPLFALATALIAAFPALGWAVGTQLLAGAGSAAFDVEIETSFQRMIPDDLLGRTMMLRRSAGTIAAALTAILAGVLAHGIGIALTFFAIGAACLLLTAWPTARLWQRLSVPS